MFLTDKTTVSFDDLDFIVKIPGDADFVPYLEESRKVEEKLTPLAFAEIGKTIVPFIESYPENWEQFPQVTKNRLLFDIAKYIFNEAMTIPEIKKK